METNRHRPINIFELLPQSQQFQQICMTAHKVIHYIIFVIIVRKDKIYYRVKTDGGLYAVKTLECSLEMLKVFGQEVVAKVFKDTEVSFCSLHLRC